MVEIFLLFIPGLCVQNADHLSENDCQSLLDFLRVSAQESPAERLHGLFVLHYHFLEPFLNL